MYYSSFLVLSSYDPLGPARVLLIKTLENISSMTAVRDGVNRAAQSRTAPWATSQKKKGRKRKNYVHTIKYLLTEFGRPNGKIFGSWSWRMDLAEPSKPSAARSVPRSVLKPNILPSSPPFQSISILSHKRSRNYERITHIYWR